MASLGELLDGLEKAISYLRETGFLPATSGNVSLRYGDVVLISPSGLDKKLLNRDTLVKVNLDGEVLYAPQGMRPSSELKLHLTVYRKVPTATFVFHVHPTYALVWADLSEVLDVHTIPEGMELFKGERVGILPPQPPGTQQFADAVAEAFFSGLRVVLIRGHGLVIWDEVDPLRCAYRIEVIERVAKLSYLKELLRR